MSRRSYPFDLRNHRKLIVGEGESDRNFFAAFCAANEIQGFGYAFTGMHAGERYEPSGFDCFVKFLPALSALTDFDLLTDLVIVCDRAEDPQAKITALRRQIRNANSEIGRSVFFDEPVANQVATRGMPRVHVLMLPHNQNGGLESVCIAVAKNHLNSLEANKGTIIEGWVNTFANDACVGWTTEKKDKLRLQSFLSAAWQKKPEITFSQLFDVTRGHLIPLNNEEFDSIKQFLKNIEAL